MWSLRVQVSPPVLWDPRWTEQGVRRSLVTLHKIQGLWDPCPPVTTKEGP